jgi:ATP-dependent RNA helicase DDX3X
MQTAALHGDLDQQERETNLKRCWAGEVRIMVATDVAARGLDIEKIALVINYDMPDAVDTYVHWVGRSGRIGNRGAAITFCSTDDNGQSLEDVDLLKKLHGIVRDAKSEVPDWLEQIVDGTATNGTSGDWGKWGGRDMRAGWDSWDKKENVEEEQAPAPAQKNDQWSSWGKDDWKK